MFCVFVSLCSFYFPVRFPRIDFPAGKLAQEKAAQQKWRQNPG